MINFFKVDSRKVLFVVYERSISTKNLDSSKTCSTITISLHCMLRRRLSMSRGNVMNGIINTLVRSFIADGMYWCGARPVEQFIFS